MTQATNSNNTSTQYTYTSGGLVKTIKNYTGTTLTSSSAYTYYPNGNVATDTENTGKVTTYLYDDLGRLTSEAITGTNNNSTLTYTYDDRGNRLTQSRGNATVTYTYDLNNRLTSHTASGVVTIYNYDENGNTISTYVGGNFAGGYTYDLFNRQKTYTPDGTVYTTTTYRPDGMRHSIGNTKHIWDNGNIVGDISGSTYKQYFRALNLIYSLIGTTTQYYRYNGHGDVVALTNSSGTVTKTYTYNAFGEEQNINATDANPFRYCGEYFDKVSGTLYLRARNYNASIGRFTQEDTIRDGINWYNYCSGNPINRFDPLGLFDWGKLLTIGLIVASTALVCAAVIATMGAAAAAVGVGAGMIASSLGASAATVATVTSVATTAATIGCATVVAANALVGVSDIVEVATDGINPIRDTVFNKNQEAYDTAKLALNVVSYGIAEFGAQNSQFQKNKVKVKSGTESTPEKGEPNSKYIQYDNENNTQVRSITVYDQNENQSTRVDYLHDHNGIIPHMHIYPTRLPNGHQIGKYHVIPWHEIDYSDNIKKY